MIITDSMGYVQDKTRQSAAILPLQMKLRLSQSQMVHSVKGLWKNSFQQLYCVFRQKLAHRFVNSLIMLDNLSWCWWKYIFNVSVTLLQWNMKSVFLSRPSSKARRLSHADAPRPLSSWEEKPGGAECYWTGVSYPASQGPGHSCTQPEVQWIILTHTEYIPPLSYTPYQERKSSVFHGVLLFTVF